MNSLVVRFLARSGCGLCDEARPLVMKAARRSGITVEEVDIDTDEHLVTAYGERVPVVLFGDDEVLAEGAIQDEKTLRRVMGRLRRS